MIGSLFLGAVGALIFPGESVAVVLVLIGVAACLMLIGIAFTQVLSFLGLDATERDEIKMNNQEHARSESAYQRRETAYDQERERLLGLTVQEFMDELEECPHEIHQEIMDEMGNQ